MGTSRARSVSSEGGLPELENTTGGENSCPDRTYIHVYAYICPERGAIEGG